MVKIREKIYQLLKKQSCLDWRRQKIEKLLILMMVLTAPAIIYILLISLEIIDFDDFFDSDILNLLLIVFSLILIFTVLAFYKLYKCQRLIRMSLLAEESTILSIKPEITDILVNVFNVFSRRYSSNESWRLVVFFTDKNGVEQVKMCLIVNDELHWEE